MIVEDETADSLGEIEPLVPAVAVERGGEEVLPFREYMARQVGFQDSIAHYNLQNALVDHLWEFYGTSSGV